MIFITHVLSVTLVIPTSCVLWTSILLVLSRISLRSLCTIPRRATLTPRSAGLAMSVCCLVSLISSLLSLRSVLPSLMTLSSRALTTLPPRKSTASRGCSCCAMCCSSPTHSSQVSNALPKLTAHVI